MTEKQVMVPQESPFCLLIISSVCLNHAVLLGLKNIFQLVSTPTGESRSWGGWMWLTVLLPLFRWLSFEVLLLFFIILLLNSTPSCLSSSFHLPHLWGSQKQPESVRGRERRKEPILLVLHSFLCHLSFIKLCLRSATLDLIQRTVLMYSF